MYIELTHRGNTRADGESTPTRSLLENLPIVIDAMSAPTPETRGAPPFMNWRCQISKKQKIYISLYTIQSGPGYVDSKFFSAMEGHREKVMIVVYMAQKCAETENV